MKLFYKQKGEYMDIYDIAYDSCGFPIFLIYDDKQWKRISAKHFAPYAPYDKQIYLEE